MTISFEIPQEIERHLRAEDADLNRDAKEVYLMEQYRHGKLSHRQLEDALALGFAETEEILKRRGLGQDFEGDEFRPGKSVIAKSRLQ